MNGDKAALFLSVDAIVVPSLWENCPYVFFEAMAHGRPVLGSLTGEMGAAARSEGWDAPTPGNVRAWSQSLVRLAHDLEYRQRLLHKQQHYFNRLHQDALPRLLENYRSPL
jgi:glycosyltransferase involved in cell wall biosynthesis